MDALASTLEPSGEEVSELLMPYVDKEEDAARHAFEVVAAVKSSVDVYSFGLRDGLSAGLQFADPNDKAAFCSQMTELANDELAKTNSSP